MGSSTRKVQQKIKKILNPKDEELLELEKAIPVVAIETLRTKKSREYFGDKDFLNLLQGGIASIKAINSGNYKEYFGNSPVIDILENKDVISVEKILEEILNKVEQQSDIESLLILKAFKTSMSLILLDDKNKNPYKFIFDFCINIIYLIIMENINEAMLDTYKDKSIDDYESEVKKFAIDWVNENLNSTIQQYLSGDIEIEELINKIQEKANVAKGDF